MSLTWEIYESFCSKVNTFAEAQSPALPVEFIGSPLTFDPPEEGKWLEVSAFFNGNENYAWGGEDGGSIEQGFFRIGVISRSGGIPDAGQLAEEIIADPNFKKGAEYGPARVYKAPELSGPFQEGDRLIVSITIYWRAGR